VSGLECRKEDVRRSMKPSRGIAPIRVVVLFVVAAGVLFAGSTSAPAAATEIPVRGMVTMVDLGATQCIPCKMMAPILEKLKQKYAGRAAIVFVDVWMDKEPAERFQIRAIPTQIFFDEQGKEVYRHVGFLNEEAIVGKLKSLGVDEK
jgi:thioredoxin 1